MRDQAVPILVYHHVYPETSPELESVAGDSAAGLIGDAGQIPPGGGRPAAKVLA